MANKKILNEIKVQVAAAGEKADEAIDSIKDAALQFKNNQIEKKREKDLSKLSPIFSSNELMNKLNSERIIRIAKRDDHHNNELCEGSMGFYDKCRKHEMITLYPENISSLGLTFYPKTEESIYVSDPFVPNFYIKINEYMDYMRKARASELSLVAHALGAKSVNILLKCSDKKAEKKSATGNAKAKNIGNANAKITQDSNSSDSFEVLESIEFKTSIFSPPPFNPPLVYFKDEQDIRSLIQMVLGGGNMIKKKTYKLKSSSTCGMSLKEATSISATVNALKCDLGFDFSDSVKGESQYYLEYTIEF